MATLLHLFTSRSLYITSRGQILGLNILKISHESINRSVNLKNTSTQFKLKIVKIIKNFTSHPSSIFFIIKNLLTLVIIQFFDQNCSKVSTTSLQTKQCALLVDYEYGRITSEKILLFHSAEHRPFPSYQQNFSKNKTGNLLEF